MRADGYHHTDFVGLATTWRQVGLTLSGPYKVNGAKAKGV